MQRQINQNTQHKVRLTPDTKEIVLKKKAELRKQCDISAVVNIIIREYKEMKELLKR